MTRSDDDARALLGRSLLGGVDSDDPVGGAPSLVSAIVADMALDIVDGRLAPGAILSSVDLARRFSTSRTPVREALMALERHGLVEVPPRRKPQVAQISGVEMRQIYAVQATLLGMVFELCATEPKDGGLDVLRNEYAAMQSAAEREDGDGYFWANIAFHDAAAAASGNMVLKRVLDPLRLRTLRLRRITLAQPGRLARSLDDHRRVLEACERGEPQLAAAIIRSLNRSAYEILEGIVAPGVERRPRRRRRAAAPAG